MKCRIFEVFSYVATNFQMHFWKSLFYYFFRNNCFKTWSSLYFFKYANFLIYLYYGNFPNYQAVASRNHRYNLFIVRKKHFSMLFNFYGFSSYQGYLNFSSNSQIGRNNVLEPSMWKLAADIIFSKSKDVARWTSK